MECKIDVYIGLEIFISDETGAYLNHLNERGFILAPLLSRLQAINSELLWFFIRIYLFTSIGSI